MSAPSPNGDGAYRCMKAALRDANITDRDISHVNCHATSTHAGDIAEFYAMEKLFGEHLPNVWISATKGNHGHMISATGAIESVFSVLSCYYGLIPPMPNLDKLDSRIQRSKLLPRIPNGKKAEEWKEKKRILLKNSFGFGGTNACVIYANYDG